MFTKKKSTRGLYVVDFENNNKRSPHECVVRTVNYAENIYSVKINFHKRNLIECLLVRNV